MNQITNMTFQAWGNSKFNESEYQDVYLEAFNGDLERAILGCAIGNDDIRFDKKYLQDRAYDWYLTELLSESRDSNLSVDVWLELPLKAQLEANRHFFNIERDVEAYRLSLLGLV